jgi:DMSO/TMAO reductase YedYZ molybdopterin-dependent catalytic subunit
MLPKITGGQGSVSGREGGEYETREINEITQEAGYRQESEEVKTMGEGFFSRGFRGRRRSQDTALPSGQYLVDGFPVLSAGPTPHTPLEEWDFSIVGEVDEPRRWTWEEFRQLPSEEITKDIHCVTKWSKLGTRWEGVSVDTLLDGVETAVEYVTAFCDGDYTTNLPLEDVTGGKAWVALTNLQERAIHPSAWKGFCP